MNRIAKVLSQISDDMLMHYGVARRSGRYPWGSGDNPYQHSGRLSESCAVFEKVWYEGNRYC